MNVFKGKEEINDMHKGDLIKMMKDLMFKNRRNTDMSYYRPIIDGNEYTWGELNRYPAQLVKVLAYRLWQQKINGKYGSEEE